MDPFRTPELVVEETGIRLPEQQCYLNLMRTAEVFSLKLNEMLSGFGVSGKQYNVLRSIRRSSEHGLPVSQIADQMTDPRADVTRITDRLERDGLVERRHDRDDRRVVRVVLTPAAQDLLARIDQPILDLHRTQFAGLNTDEVEALTTLLIKARSVDG